MCACQRSTAVFPENNDRLGGCTMNDGERETTHKNMGADTHR